MTWTKRSAFWMLVAVVLWTTAPLTACVPVVASGAKADCCAGMMQTCGGGTMQNGECCRLAPVHSPAAVISVYAPEHGQQPGVLMRAEYLPLLTEPRLGRHAVHETPPPDPSPGGISILRI